MNFFSKDLTRIVGFIWLELASQRIHTKDFFCENEISFFSPVDCGLPEEGGP